MRATETAPLRRWWAARTAGLAKRWAADRGWCAALSLLLTALTLLFSGGCLVLGLTMAHTIAPQWFAPDERIASNSTSQSANYPIAPLAPGPAAPDPAPIPVATSALGMPTASLSPTPMPGATPTPLPFGQPTATPPTDATATPIPTAACPDLAGLPTLSGRSVQDGVIPAPLIGGCPALLVIAASSQANAPIVGTLTFGTLDPAGCTVALSGTTDAGGNATLRFTVPGTDCFRGSIITSGQLVVGDDSSANTSFQAEG
jgi:hypothetical protein